MKKFFLLLTVFTSLIAQSQVGVNTTDPKTTLHIVPSNTDPTTAEGIIAPNLTRSDLIAKNIKYTQDQKGAIVFVTDLSGELDKKTAKITKAGYYYFDGSLWQPFGNTDPMAIPTEPWQIQGGQTPATLNSDNIYQTGSVGIGASTVVDPAYKFQVSGSSNITGNSRVGSSTVLGNEQVGGNLGVKGLTTLDGITITKETRITGVLRYSIGAPAANKVLISSDANGNATWGTAQSLITIPTEPLQVQATTTKATLNTENVYQQGKLAIGTTSATPVSAYNLDVNGTSNVSGNSRVGSSTVLGNEQVNGNMGVLGTLNVTGATGLSNSLTVAGVSNLNGETNAKATTITGQLRYTIGTPAANKVLISSDANGNATWGTAQSLITIPTEPLQVQATTTKATLNTENVYQQGKLAIGTTSATPVSAYNLDVNGTSNVSGNSRVGSSTVLGNEQVNGNMGVGGTLNVTGATGLSNSLTVAGVSNLNGTTNAKATNIVGQLNYKPTGANPAANTYLRTDASGNATWQALPAYPVVPTEPLQVQATTTKATLNTENVYQQGKLAIGTTSATPVSAYNLDVNGTSNVSGNSRVGSSTVLANSAIGGNETVGGSLGLGTTVLNQKLNVTGNEYISGTSRVGGASTGYNTSAQLELADTDKGFLPNRVALTSATVKAPVANAVAGMFVYNTATVASQGLSPGYYYWTGTSWTRLVDKIPSVKVNMYYSTSNVKGGSASGSNQASMVSIPFSTSQKVNSPVAIKLPETGSYAFNVKLYSSIGSTAPAVGVSGNGGKVITYVGIWVNGSLQDVSEVFTMLSSFAGGGALNANFVTNVVLGCTGNEGDTIDIRLGYYIATVPSGTAVWSQGKVSATPASDATSMIFWKL